MHSLIIISLQTIISGSISDEVTYDEYVSRFITIYPKTENEFPQFIYTSGDNDIGGEGTEPVSPEMIRRFSQYFPERKEVLVKKHSSSLKLQFVNHNVLSMQLSQKNTKEVEYGSVNTEEAQKRVKIALSHIPLSPQAQR